MRIGYAFIVAILGHRFVEMIATLVPDSYVNDVYYVGGGVVLTSIGYILRLFRANGFKPTNREEELNK